jgi:hypothetical protein
MKRLKDQFGQFSGFSFQIFIIIALKILVNHISIYYNYNLFLLPNYFVIVSPVFGGIAFFYAKRIDNLTTWRGFIFASIGFIPVWLVAISFLFSMREGDYMPANWYKIYYLAVPLCFWSSGVFHLINAIRRKSLIERNPG